MALHVSQVSFFKPIINGLQDDGVNVDRLLNHSGLAKFNLDDLDNYVPVQSIYALFDAINKHEGISDLLDQYSKLIQLVSLSQWGEMIAYAPDLLSACQLGVKYDRVVNSHERAGFEIMGTKAKYWQRFIDKPGPGREQAVFIDFALAINGFRLAGGESWVPLEVHLQSDIAPNFDALLTEGNNTKILLDQPATAIVFPTSILANSMLGGNTSKEFTTEFSPPITLAGKLESILSSLQPGFIPTLELVSEMTESSARTLQRNLTQEGTSVSQVVDQWRFKKNLQLLEDPNQLIKDISEQLGYSNVPNFERAFKRWAGTSAQRYRQAV